MNTFLSRKNSIQPRTNTDKRGWARERTASRGLGIGIGLLLLLGVVTVSFGANSYVVGYQGVNVMDSAVDNLGITYLLGQDTNKCVLRKYDTAGGEVPLYGDVSACTSL